MVGWKHVRRGRLLLRGLTVALIFAAAMAGFVRPGTAAGNGPVNVTLNIAADLRPNPCTAGDVVNLSGTLHIVFYVRSDGQGGYHINQLVDEKAKGISLTTGISYQGSDTYDHSFYAGAPFPANDTQTHSVELVSRATTNNLIMGYVLHTTVNAGGIPTATVDNVRLDCKG
jgi:hypothetical protein